MNPLVLTALVLGVIAFLAWVLSVKLRDVSIVDIGWGGAYALVAGTTLYTLDEVSARAWLLLILVSLWGLRLTIFLGMRNIGHGEDRRYAAMRASIGPRYWWVSLFSVFGLQVGLIWGISMPIQMGMASPPSSLGLLDGMGIGLWAVGLYFESVGDYQLARFKRDPANAGKVMDTGLWAYTRHPNYFGDFCVWWGIYLVAVGAGAAWTVFSPLVMSVLLLKVSGVTLLEKTIGERRPGYAAYVARTNSFFPWPPRRSKPST